MTNGSVLREFVAAPPAITAWIEPTTTKEAKDLQVGDVHLHAGMVRYKVIGVTPIGNGGYVEIHSEQVGKPDNVSVATMPAHTPMQVLTTT